ncbi:MAG: glycosyltransferase family 2 protein [Bifidobacteriaceae bacterium]|jgi:glycosyltransferase involved in cell wall biosynthesis|nr:glycosyltransferase family 2 protein [Bifidobacteriaceae bacterium]
MGGAEFDDLWVVVPVYNEARVLAQTLTELTAQFPHVCVVDDASADQSGAIAEAFFDRGARLVSHPINLGQGAGLQTGFEYVLRDPAMARVVTFDADGQHLVSDAAAWPGGWATVSTWCWGRGSWGWRPTWAASSGPSCGWPWPTPISRPG